MGLADGFLQDILARPDDDTPRLIYADWLDERGDPGDAERARFIRLQCERARLAPGDSRAKRLRTLERKLEKAHGDAWRRPLPPVPHLTAELRRGFVEHVGLSPGAFLDHAAALFAAHPVRAVTLELNPFDVSNPFDVILAGGPRPLDLPLIRRLAASPSLGRLGALAFQPRPYDGMALGDAGLRVLAGSPHLGGLRSLALPRNDLTDDAIGILDAAPFAPTLQRLALPRNRLGPGAGAALAGAKRLTGLTHLDLSHNRLLTQGVRALAASPHLGLLQVLALNRLAVRVLAARALAGCEGLRDLRVLELNNNRLEDSGARALAASPHLAGLAALALRRNRIGVDGVAALAESPHLKGLKTLELGGNAIDREGREALRARFGKRFGRF